MCPENAPYICSVLKGTTLINILTRLSSLSSLGYFSNWASLYCIIVFIVYSLYFPSYHMGAGTCVFILSGFPLLDLCFQLYPPIINQRGFLFDFLGGWCSVWEVWFCAVWFRNHHQRSEKFQSFDLVLSIHSFYTSWNIFQSVNVCTLTVWHVNVFLCYPITWRKYTVGFSVNVFTPLYKHIPQTDCFFLCKCVGCQLLAPWPVGGPCCSVQTLTTVPTNQSAGRCLISWSNIFIFLFQHNSFTGNCIITSQNES